MLWRGRMRPRTLLSDVHPEAPKPVRGDATVGTYERVRKTLDEALAELQLPPSAAKDDSGVIKLRPNAH